MDFAQKTAYVMIGCLLISGLCLTPVAIIVSFMGVRKSYHEWAKMWTWGGLFVCICAFIIAMFN